MVHGHGPWSMVHGHGPWLLKNSIRLKKFMQVGIDVKCMHTNFGGRGLSGLISFGGRGLSGFGDLVTYQKRPNFPFGAWTIVHGHRKI